MTPTPADPPRVKPLAAAEIAVRRFLLMIGFGFAAFVGGSMIAVAMGQRLVARLEGSGAAVQLVAWFVMTSGWVLFALPCIAYLAARFLEVKPWPTALIGAGTGLMFQLALQYVSSGAEGIVADLPQQLARLAGVGAGVVATAWAVKRGRELAKVAEDKARVEAEKKKTQYDEFVKQAEALADRREQVPIAPQAPVAAEVPAEGSPLPRGGEGQGEGQ